MSRLRPTLWRTCRVIACETRLRLLWLVFEHGGLCVCELAQAAGISDQNASNQLRAINARGLITPRRNRLRVIYYPEPNLEVEHADALLAGLRHCCETGMPFKTVIRQATAFTHARRIQIVRILATEPCTFGVILERTGMPTASLAHHLSKLETRGFIKRFCGVYRLRTPGNPFGRVLMKAVCA